MLVMTVSSWDDIFLLAEMKGLLAWDEKLIGGWFAVVRGFGSSPLKSMRG